jgi:phosphomannomutase/phosphoglucomutase
LIKDIPRYYTSDDTRIFCPDKEKFKVVERLKEKFKLSHYKMVTIDGVKVFLKNGWFLIRASNTQSAIVLRWEATTPKEFELIGKFAKTQIKGLKNKYKHAKKDCSNKNRFDKKV